MNKVMYFIDSLPALPVILIGAWMGLAPFTPEPHLVQKFFMAVNGDAFKLIDVFDVFMHGGFAALAATKAWRVLNKNKNTANQQDA